MTNFILMRHGEAGVHSDDSKRVLTEQGRHDVHTTAQQIKASGLAISEIWASPLVRAQQTAEIAAEVVGLEAPIFTCPAITPCNSVRDAVYALERAESERVLVCFHQPLISRLVEYLTEQPVSVPTATAFELHSGSLLPGGFSLGRTFLA